MTKQRGLPLSGARKIALMSIKPVFWERIADGEKRYELRRTPIHLDDGDLVVVYASSPEKALVGWFEVEDVIRAPKDCVWRRFGPDLGVSRSVFRDYFDGADLATAIGIRSPRAFDRIPLAVLRKRLPDFRPPQSFMYWPGDVIHRLRLESTLIPANETLS